MNMREQVIVLNSTAGNLHTGRAVTQLAVHTGLHGLRFDFTGEEEPTADHITYVFTDHTRGARMILVDDYLNNLAYVALHDVQESTVGLMIGWLRDHVGIANLHDVKSRLRTDLEGQAVFLTHLGLMERTDETDPGTLDILYAALGSTQVATVERALIASQLLGWPELKSAVEHLTRHARHPHLRDFAARVLAQSGHR